MALSRTSSRTSSPGSSPVGRLCLRAPEAWAVVLADCGIAVSVYLTAVHYQDSLLVCTGVSDCETVQTSKYAKLFGIPVGRRVFLVFLANGVLAGLAGVLYASRFNSVGANTGLGMELDVVAAAVVGGVAIFGGSGTVVGAAIGAVLLTTITSALTALRVDKFWQQAIVGVLILAAIIIDRVASLRTARKLRMSEARDV